MGQYNIVAETSENTVVSEYKSNIARSSSYQSEAELEKEFIKSLMSQGYEYIDIHSDQELLNNLRKQLEKLNNIKFSNNEWDNIYKEYINNPNNGVIEKTQLLQEGSTTITIKRDDDQIINIRLIDKTNIHNNFLQVINQKEISKEEGAKHDNRYDVTILVNGFPLVHIELKRRGVPIKQAFNQINRYINDSFSSGSRLYEFVQIFVISNGTHTKYYSNTTRNNVIKEHNGLLRNKTSSSFDFTSYWADAKNKNIFDLMDFAQTFFVKSTLLNILTKYCVFTSEKMLLVMRPYQITAAEKILNRIEIANNYKWYGSVKGGGYIWHTTGSGKTLTSFKTAQLATKLSYIDKVLFVVDRKDLDYQTMKEYDRFEKGCANSNRSTTILTNQLEDKDEKGNRKESKIIITTIQKLSTFIKKNPKHDIYDKNIVLIFDECHRSQFGDMHKAIINHFKKYYIFGFTGTPIFAENAGTFKNNTFITTSQAFGDQLHTYTIVNAINDNNVLPFRVDYISTTKQADNIKDEQVYDIDRKAIFLDPIRINIITKYILEHFNQKTYRNGKQYQRTVISNVDEVVKDRKVKEEKAMVNHRGFNSILCCSSVEGAMAYYNEFRKLQENIPDYLRLRIATIYSFSANPDLDEELFDDENLDNTNELDKSARDFLDGAIKDYNKMFQTQYSTDGDLFQNYYKDVSMRMKNKEIDLLIVVNMFLTGFDAPTLNTLWVDKNLKKHGLIQAFSRTNRILNSVKSFGNIVCFRNLSKRVDDAISLFGDENAGGIVLIKTFKNYFYGYEDKNGKHIKGYIELIEELFNKFPLGSEIISEKAKKEFLALFGSILRLRNILVSFDEFNTKDILKERDLQDYLSLYQDTHDQLVRHKDKPTDVNDDIVYEAELIKQIEINIDYILLLISKLKDTHGNDKELKISIQKAIDSSPELRSKKALIEAFIEGINDIDDVLIGWHNFIGESKEEDVKKIIEENNLKEKETREYLSKCWENGEVISLGEDLDKIMPPMSRFGNSNRDIKKAIVLEKIREFFDKYYSISNF